MNKHLRYFLHVCWCALCLWLPLSQANEVKTPQRIVHETADALLSKLRREQIVAETAEEQLTTVVKVILTPVIDFRRLAYRTMAKHYKRASREQFLSFTEAIKQSLINTYANPLIETDSQALAEKLAVEIREVKKVGGKTPRTAVSTWLKVGNTQKYSVVYFFYFNKSKNTWLVENMAIEGIDLLISFRNQYQRLISANQQDIDKVTTIWAASKANGS